MKSRKIFWNRLVRFFLIVIFVFLGVFVQRATYWTDLQVENQRVDCWFCPTYSVTQSIARFDEIAVEIAEVALDYGLEYDLATVGGTTEEDGSYQFNIFFPEVTPRHIVTVSIQNVRGIETYRLQYVHLSNSPAYEPEPDWQAVMWEIAAILSQIAKPTDQVDAFMNRIVPKAQAWVESEPFFENWRRTFYFNALGTTGLEYTQVIYPADGGNLYLLGWDIFGPIQRIDE